MNPIISTDIIAQYVTILYICMATLLKPNIVEMLTSGYLMTLLCDAHMGVFMIVKVMNAVYPTVFMHSTQCFIYTA